MRFTLSKLFVAVALLALACSGMFYRTGLWADSIFTLTIVLLIGALFWSIGRTGRDRAAGLAGGIVGLGYLFLITSALFSEIRTSLLTNYPLAWAARAMRLDTVGIAPPYYATPAYSATTLVPISGTPVPATDPAIAFGFDSEPAAKPSGSAPTVEPDPVAAPILGPPTVPPPATGVLIPAVSPQYAIRTLINYGLSFGNEEMTVSHFFLIGHCVWSWLLALLGAWLAGRMYDRRERAARAAG
jgi:hypothetical protein